MAKKSTTRAAAKKMKDKWRAKQWYTIRAPEMFDNKEISETLGDDPNKILGRIVEVTAQDLTGDYSKMHIKLQFKIDRIHTDSAYTSFIGHDMTSDYIRRLTKRRRSKTDGVFDVETKDKYLVRLKPLAVADKRIQGSQQSAIRKIMGETIRTEVRRMTLANLVRSILSAELNKKIVKACKPIYPLKKIEIRKSEILRAPEIKETVKAPEKSKEVGTSISRKKLPSLVGDEVSYESKEVGTSISRKKLPSLVGDEVSYESKEEENKKKTEPAKEEKAAGEKEKTAAKTEEPEEKKEAPKKVVKKPVKKIAVKKKKAEEKPEKEEAAEEKKE